MALRWQAGGLAGRAVQTMPLLAEGALHARTPQALASPEGTAAGRVEHPWPCGGWTAWREHAGQHNTETVHACIQRRNKGCGRRGLVSGLRGHVAQAKARDAEARSSPLEGSMAQRAGGRSSTIRQGRTAGCGALAGPSFHVAPEGAECLPFLLGGAASGS